MEGRFLQRLRGARFGRGFLVPRRLCLGGKRSVELLERRGWWVLYRLGEIPVPHLAIISDESGEWLAGVRRTRGHGARAQSQGYSQVSMPVCEEQQEYGSPARERKGGIDAERGPVGSQSCDGSLNIQVRYNAIAQDMLGLPRRSAIRAPWFPCQWFHVVSCSLQALCSQDLSFH